MLDIVASYHCMQFQENLMKQMSENGKRPSFKPNFALNSGHHFFLKNLALSITRYHGQLSSCTISDKTKDPILRKLSDR